MLNDLGDVGDVARANFTEDTLIDPNHSANKPVPLIGALATDQKYTFRIYSHPENADCVERTERRAVWLDHAEHAMELPVDEEDDKKVVGIPETFEISTASLLHRVPNHHG